MIDLRSRTAIASTLMLKWTIPNFETAYITDFTENLTYEGNTYTSIGKLLSISNTTSELKASPNDLTIDLSGIPTGSILDILNKEIKGSSVWIYRTFFDPISYAAIDIGGGNTVLKFKGIVTNYSITDNVDSAALTATSTITLTCSSMVEVLTNKVSGRRTNPVDFPNEKSMSRVQILSNSNLNFGAP